jgi:hypothetical protein
MSTHLVVNMDNGQDDAKLEEPLKIVIEYDAPAGQETDFASVPRFFQRLFPKCGKYSRAAVIHDHLYRQGIGNKLDADRALLTIMAFDKVPLWQCVAIYSAVRLFGGGAWKGKKKRAKR